MERLVSELQFKAILAGIFFSLWPIFMNRSGLTGNVASFVFSLTSLLFVIPFAFRNIDSSILNANWLMAISAGVVAASGLLLFNGVLAKTTPEEISNLFVLMLVVQIAVSAIYQIILTGNLSLSRTLGFAATIIAAILLR